MQTGEAGNQLVVVDPGMSSRLADDGRAPLSIFGVLGLAKG